jgi:hypothetical protein
MAGGPELGNPANDRLVRLVDRRGLRVFRQLFQLAGAVWIWRLAGSPGWRLLGLRPFGEIRPSRWFVPVFGFNPHFSHVS